MSKPAFSLPDSTTDFLSHISPSRLSLLDAVFVFVFVLVFVFVFIFIFSFVSLTPSAGAANPPAGLSGPG